MMGLGVLQLGIGIVATALALLAYRDDGDRPLLYLGVGLFGMTVVPVLVQYLGQYWLEVQIHTMLSVGLETVGLVVVLASVVLARNR
jgi:hypothetical protein